MKGSWPEEASWLPDIRAGKPDAIAAIYDAYARRLYGYLRSLGASGALAEDVLQEVFLRLVRKRPAPSSRKSLKAYLFKAVRLEYFGWRRKLFRRKERRIEDLPCAFEAADEGLSVEEAKSIEEALLKLPGSQREAVVMKIYGNLTFEEIGEVMETSVNTAASRYRYAIEKLRKVLE